MAMRTARGLVGALAFAALLAAAPPARMASLDVAAFDAKERFVADLRPDELRVSDAGKPQEIAFFRRGSTIPHAVAVLIDLLNGDMEQRITEWNKTVRALAHTESAWDAFIYVLTPSGALYPVRPMPDSWAGWTPPEPFWEREILPVLENLKSAYLELPGYNIKRAYRERPKYQDEIDPRPEATAWALEELRVRLAAVPGHAAVVWAGPIGWGKAETAMPHSARLSDGRVLPTVPVYVAGSPSAIRAAAGTNLAGSPSTARILPYSDVKEVIPRASAEARQYYRVGWRPGEDNWNGKPHSLRVTCTRAGVRIAAKDSYQAPKLLDVAEDQRQAVPDLLPPIAFNSSQIRFSTTIAGPRLTIRLDPSDLVPQHGRAQLAVGVMEAAPGETRELLGGARSLDLAVTDQSIPVSLELGTGMPDSLRVIVLDRVSGAFGTRTVRRTP